MHHRILLRSPWAHEGSTEVTGLVPEHRNDTAAEVRGRAALTLRTGSATLDLRPTATELRNLAAQLVALATDLEAPPPGSGQVPPARNPGPPQAPVAAGSSSAAREQARHTPPYWMFAPRTAAQERIQHPRAEPAAHAREQRAAP